MEHDEEISFEWDEEKSQHNLSTRGFDFAYVTQLFNKEVIERDDNRQNYGEQRTLLFGYIKERPFLVTYTIREHKIRIISARHVHIKEVKKWQKLL